MAHPDGIAPALLPNAVEKRAWTQDLDLGAAEFAAMAMARDDLAAELLRHHLLAIADAENRHAGVKQRGGRARRTGVQH